MDAQRKSIQSLTVSMDEKREELSVLYRQFGSKLLNDSVDGESAASALDTERVEAWRAFMTSRETDTQTVLDIKAALARLSELNQFKKQLEASRGEGVLALDQRLEAFGSLLFTANPDNAETLFGENWASAAALSSAVADLESRQRASRDELEASGFFGKMKAQFRLAGLESDLRQKREKLAKAVRKIGRAALDNETFSQRIGEGAFEPELLTAWNDAREALSHVDELAGRGDTLDSDIQAVKDTLDAAGALENPQRRMDELRNRIRETDRRIDSHTALTAREYTDKFFDEEGCTRLGTSGSSAESGGLGVYAQQLERASSLCREIGAIRTQIEILETGIKIEALNRNISQWQHTVKDYEQRIRKYQDLIETTGRDIAEAEAERDRLEKVRQELERAGDQA